MGFYTRLSLRIFQQVAVLRLGAGMRQPNSYDKWEITAFLSQERDRREWGAVKPAAPSLP